MKHFKYSIAAILLLTAGMMTAAKAQTAEQIIKKHIAAIGGAKKWNKITSIKISGIINVRGTDMSFTKTVVKGKGEREDYSFNGKSSFQIFTTTNGWAYVPQAGRRIRPEAVPGVVVKQSQDRLQIEDPLIDYQAKGNKVEYIGKGSANGIDCYKLKVTPATGAEKIMYIDASSYYHVRTTRVEKENNKGIEEEEALYSNYKKLPEGIVYPMTMDDEKGTLTVKTVAINIPVVDSIVFNPYKY